MSANQTAIACAQEDVLGAGRLAQRLLRLVAAHTTAARGDARHRADRVHPASCPSLVNGHAIGGRGVCLRRVLGRFMLSHLSRFFDMNQ